MLISSTLCHTTCQKRCLECNDTDNNLVSLGVLALGDNERATMESSKDNVYGVHIVKTHNCLTDMSPNIVNRYFI